MPPTKTLPLNDIFASPKVATFFSDRSVDFVLQEGQTDLTASQKEHLSEQFGFPIKQLINIRQVHGQHIITASAEDLKNSGSWLEADGVITNVLGLPIAV